MCFLGESGAGAKMAHLLHIMSAMNVCVLVSRWYGGIHLSNDRWKHINNCTRQVLEEFQTRQKQQQGGKQAKGKG